MNLVKNPRTPPFGFLLGAFATDPACTSGMEQWLECYAAMLSVVREAVTTMLQETRDNSTRLPGMRCDFTHWNFVRCVAISNVLA